jgi:hypothetical protein
MNGKFRIAALATIFATAIPMPADPYTQCLIDHCFGNFEGDPVGYEACRRWCWRTSGGGYAPPMVAKLD